jgi:hypothetical protein
MIAEGEGAYGGTRGHGGDRLSQVSGRSGAVGLRIFSYVQLTDASVAKKGRREVSCSERRPSS